MLTIRILDSKPGMNMWSQFFLLLILSPLLSFSQERNLTNHSSEDRHPDFSGDGKKIVFESDRSGKWGIYELTLPSNQVTCLVCNEFDNRVPSYCENDKSVLFESNRLGHFEAYQFNLLSGEIKKMIPSSTFLFNQQWNKLSPDGRFLAFSSDSLAQSSWNVFVYDVALRAIKPLTKSVYNSLYPCWNSSSKKIIFFSRSNRNGVVDEIFEQDVSTSKVITLVSDSTNCFCPHLAKGKKLSYARSVKNGRPEIYLLDLKQESTLRITSNEEGDTEPCYSDRLKAIAWTGYRNGNYDILIKYFSQ